MNSIERRERRYLNRKAQREVARLSKTGAFDDFDKVFSWDNLYQSFKKSCLGVGWKCSTQTYRANAVENVTRVYNDLKNGTYKTKGFFEFDIMERGKLRHIKSVHIEERSVQKCLCDYSLTPMLRRSFIYDNGACMKGKGIDFALNRIKRQLREFYRKYGTAGYILTFDFSKYFDTINHKVLKEKIAERYTDTRILELLYTLIDNFGGECGLGLGSQISQTCALFYPNELDHTIKEKLGIKYYGRYMDDGYLIYQDKAHLTECLEVIFDICNQLGIKLNKNKTQIIKLSRYFTFLKKRIKLTDTGKVVMKVSRTSINTMARKLRKFKRKYSNGEMPMESIRTSFTSWLGHIEKYASWKTAVNAINKYLALFGDAETIMLSKQIRKRRMGFIFRREIKENTK